MIRTHKIKVDYILTADWHLREDVPACFAGDWEKYQWETIKFISDLQKKYECPVLHSGDLFHHWKPSPALLSQTSIRLPKEFYSVYGNHDLPQHNMSIREKCGLYNLIINGVASILDDGSEWEGCSWRETPTNIPYNTDNTVLIWHKMTYQNQLPYPGCTEPKATKLLRKYNEYNLIVTGDNHQSFVVEYDGRLLVNPGCITIQDASMIDHEPSVYLYSAQTNEVKRVKIPQHSAEFSTEHLEISKEKNERIESFISKLKSGWKVELDFEANLKRFQKKNKIKQSIMEIIYKSMDYEK